MGETSLLLVTTSVRLAQFPAGRESAPWWVWTKATAPSVGQQGGRQGCCHLQDLGTGEVCTRSLAQGNFWAALQRGHTLIPFALPQIQKKPIFSPSKPGQAISVLMTMEPVWDGQFPTGRCGLQAGLLELEKSSGDSTCPP